MARVLIVCDHPSLHRGFATVGRHIARGLHATGRWQVRMIGRYPPARQFHAEPYDVLDADTEEDGLADADARVGHLLRTLADGEPSGGPPTPLISIGTAPDQHALVKHLGDTDLRRRLRIIAYMPVDYAPLPPAIGRLLQDVQVIVPFTSLASEALAEACRGVFPVAAPIPHGVDLETFHPPDPAERRALRRRRFGLDDDGFLIGFFGRNTAHKRPDLAIRIFGTFASGAWSRCEACASLTAWSVHPLDGSRARPSACQRCESQRLTGGTCPAVTRLFLHSELLTRQQRAWSGGWDLAALAGRSGAGNLVDLMPSLQVGEGVDAAELALLMGACDAHLLPFEGGGWELTVLETGACGVANVITDAGAPPEYAAPFSLLVPPAALLWDTVGVRAFIDESRAVEALVRLATDRELRGCLGARGPAVAVGLSWAHVVRRWQQLLEAGAGRPAAVEARDA